MCFFLCASKSHFLIASIPGQCLPFDSCPRGVPLVPSRWSTCLPVQTGRREARTQARLEPRLQQVVCTVGMVHLASGCGTVYSLKFWGDFAVWYRMQIVAAKDLWLMTSSVFYTMGPVITFDDCSVLACTAFYNVSAIWSPGIELGQNGFWICKLRMDHCWWMGVLNWVKDDKYLNYQVQLWPTLTPRSFW